MQHFFAAGAFNPARRRFVLGTVSAACALHAVPRARAAAQVPHRVPEVLTGHQLDLAIGETQVNFTGRSRRAVTVNQSLPAPVLRWREGEEVSIRVHNRLGEDTSIHWHGIILPSAMDGVPGLSFAGIRPGDVFEYRFPLRQSGTYWYHSHSNFQEQIGLYGALIIDPAEADPVRYDRDMVVLLSDWSDTDPHRIYATLKKQSHYYNRRERTLGDLWRDLKNGGLRDTLDERAMWNRMRMSDRDLADVTGYTYTFLMNGVTPAAGWVGVFQPGERVRLRFINGSAMTLFDVRIPGLKMTVVAADGQNVKPVEVDEFRMGVAETYDVIVEPAADRAYTLFAQSIDRSGYARGTLTPDPSWQAEIPALDPPPVLTHRDMGMAHSHGATEHGGHSAESGETSNAVEARPNATKVGPSRLHSVGNGHAGHAAGKSQTDHKGTRGHEHRGHPDPASHAGHVGHTGPSDSNPASHSGAVHHEESTGHRDHSDHANAAHAAHADHADQANHAAHVGRSGPATGAAHDRIGHNHAGIATVQVPVNKVALARAGFGANFDEPRSLTHAPTEIGPHVDGRAEVTPSGLADPGVGLREHQERYGRRVLTYADLRALSATRDLRQPTREIELHLTGNMHRYMWSVNGLRHSEAPPIVLHYGERVRFVLVNDTMMTHPFHLHGLWSELETGDPAFIPRKHTILVQPGSRISYLVTADAMGRWAYHCHMLYHMPGMMREVRVI